MFFMKKLLLTLATLVGAGSLHGMESQKQLSPISLAQTYHQFLHSDPKLLPEITQHIFSLHLKASGIDLVTLPQKIKQSCKDPKSLVQSIETLIDSCGYQLANKLCKLSFPQKISICDIKNALKETPLHRAIYHNLEVAKILIKIADNNDNVWTLLTTKECFGKTALHIAAYYGQIEIVKLLLDSAGDNALTLRTMKDTDGNAAFDIATPNVQKVMKEYVQKNQ